MDLAREKVLGLKHVRWMIGTVVVYKFNESVPKGKSKFAMDSA